MIDERENKMPEWIGISMLLICIFIVGYVIGRIWK